MKNTKFIIIGNQKGGVGKSTMTSVMANFIANNTSLKVLVFDCDDLQETLYKKRHREMEFLKENNLRLKNEAYQIVKVNSNEFKNVVSKYEGDYDFIFIDVPGNLKQTGVIECYLAADYIFMPTDITEQDMDSTISFYNEVDKKIIPIRRQEKLVTVIYAFLNKINKVTRTYKEFDSYKDQLPFNFLNTHIGYSSVTFGDKFSTISDYSFMKGKENLLDNLCIEIMEVVGVKVSIENI